MKNLIAGAKNIGTTHITNGCYRLHPVEWNVGEAAGALAAYSLEKGFSPTTIHDEYFEDFQERLRDEGVPTEWRL
jgi:hypothetical protein